MKLLRNDIYESLKMALATLRTNKLRSALTVVGVVIGVWTVMAIASIISGIAPAVTQELASFGGRRHRPRDRDGYRFDHQRHRSGRHQRDRVVRHAHDHPHEVRDGHSCRTPL